MASTAVTAATVLKAPKAMQVACVALPEGVTQYGKDGYQLPGGIIVFGHGVCVVRNTADYDKVQACRGTKRAAGSEGEEEEGAEDKAEAKQRRKAARLVAHLPLVRDYLGEEDKAKLARLAGVPPPTAAAPPPRAAPPRGPATGPVKPPTPASSGAISISDSQEQVDAAAEVQQQRLERTQSQYWDQLQGAAPADSEAQAFREAQQAATAAALKAQVFQALGESDSDSDSDTPARALFPKTGRQAELVAALKESRRGQGSDGEEEEAGSEAGSDGEEEAGSEEAGSEGDAQ